MDVNAAYTFEACLVLFGAGLLVVLAHEEDQVPYLSAGEHPDLDQHGGCAVADVNLVEAVVILKDL
jgi:hypothetical protein